MTTLTSIEGLRYNVNAVDEKSVFTVPKKIIKASWYDSTPLPKDLVMESHGKRIRFTKTQGHQGLESEESVIKGHYEDPIDGLPVDEYWFAVAGEALVEIGIGDPTIALPTLSYLARGIMSAEEIPFADFQIVQDEQTPVLIANGKIIEPIIGEAGKWHRTTLVEETDKKEAGKKKKVPYWAYIAKVVPEP